MSVADLPNQAAETIRSQAPNFKPKVAIILGSGQGGLVDAVKNPITIDYVNIPGFRPASVKGHLGRLVLGQLGGQSVICMQGRVHHYEGCDNASIINPIRTLKCLGIEILICTAATGSCRLEIKPGSLVLLKDHINFQGHQPLIGPNDDNYGSRFYPMADAYDPEFRSQLLAVAKQQNISLVEGVYVAALGPNYETPAEIRAFQIMGADIVGQSTVPEVLVARHANIRIIGISTVSNFASGLSEEVLSHDNVLKVVSETSSKLTRLLLAFLEQLTTLETVAAPAEMNE